MFRRLITCLSEIPLYTSTGWNLIWNRNNLWFQKKLKVKMKDVNERLAE